MASTLSEQMLVAYDRSRSRASVFWKRHKSAPAFRDIDEFELQLRKRFLSGVHTAFSREIIAWLRRNVGPQQQIANLLGLKDRTSISKMQSSGVMDGIRITAALYQFGKDIPLPTRERAALHGFARATSFIKAQVHQDDSLEDSMTPQEFSDLIGVLASDEWDDAIRNPDPTVARAVAVRILDERETSTRPIGRSSKHRAEQCVQMLIEVQEEWGDYGVIALTLISDWIPTGASEKAGTL